MDFTTGPNYLKFSMKRKDGFKIYEQEHTRT